MLSLISLADTYRVKKNDSDIKKKHLESEPESKHGVEEIAGRQTNRFSLFNQKGERRDNAVQELLASTPTPSLSRLCPPFCLYCSAFFSFFGTMKYRYTCSQARVHWKLLCMSQKLRVSMRPQLNNHDVMRSKKKKKNCNQTTQ